MPANNCVVRSTQMLNYDHTTSWATMPVAMGRAQQPTCLKLQVSHRAQVLQPTAHSTCANEGDTPTHCTRFALSQIRGPHWQIRGPLGGQSIHSSWSEFNAISKTASRSKPLVSRYLTHSQDAPRPHTNYNVAPQECCRPPFPCCKDFGKGRAVAPHILIAKGRT